MSPPGDQVNHQVENKNFGSRLGLFPGKTIGLRTWFLIIVPGSLITIFSFFYGTLLAGDAYQQHGPALALIRAQSWFILATISLILLATFTIFRTLISLQRIEVFERGIKYRSFFLRRRTYRWSEFAGIASSAVTITFFGKNIRTTPSGKLFLKKGRIIELTNRYQNIPHLIELVKSKIYRQIWPILKSDFRSGKTVHFGKITLNKNHLRMSNQQISWNSVKNIQIRSGFLVVALQDDSSLRKPTANIPNIELLLKIVDWGINP
jgi:hypothetical protein